MALEHPQMMTVEEYFHLEETDTENRYEYIDGQVYMMAGGTFDHSTISGNIYSLLRGLLRGKPCRVYNSDIKVQISQKRYVHPDITVTCDPRDRGTGDLLKSPRVIKEKGRWMYDIYKAQETVTLPSLGVHFPLRDAYLDIEIEESSLEEESDHETN
jgi:hypothetical protein